MPQFSSSSVALSRRRFLALSGIVPAALLAQSLGGRAFGAAEAAVTPAVGLAKSKKYPIGLELYSVRTELARDLSGTLARRRLRRQSWNGIRWQRAANFHRASRHRLFDRDRPPNLLRSHRR